MPKRKNIKIDREKMIRDRLAYIGTLAGGLAHEVRNPLNSIMLNTDMLMDQTGELPGEKAEKFRKRLSRIHQETKNLQNIVSEFLTFARPPRVELTPTDINDFFYDTIEFLREECDKKNIQIHFHFQKEMYPVLVDQKQFGQVIFNLIQNAADAIGKDGHIDVFTRDLEQNELELRIEDSGPGVSSELRDKIFDVFFTTKDKGTGLGLGIASRIVSEHGGRIFLDAPEEPNRNTAFVIRLPRRIFLSYEEDSE